MAPKPSPIEEPEKARPRAILRRPSPQRAIRSPNSRPEAILRWSRPSRVSRCQRLKIRRCPSSLRRSPASSRSQGTRRASPAYDLALDEVIDTRRRIFAGAIPLSLVRRRRTFRAAPRSARWGGCHGRNDHGEWRTRRAPRQRRWDRGWLRGSVVSASASSEGWHRRSRASRSVSVCWASGWVWPSCWRRGGCCASSAPATVPAPGR